MSSLGSCCCNTMFLVVGDREHALGSVCKSLWASHSQTPAGERCIQAFADQHGLASLPFLDKPIFVPVSSIPTLQSLSSL